ncbi:hypothetical protein AAMO2058_000186200 [Amorphochlora amoebiformis]
MRSEGISGQDSGLKSDGKDLGNQMCFGQVYDSKDLKPFKWTCPFSVSITGNKLPRVELWLRQARSLGIGGQLWVGAERMCRWLADKISREGFIEGQRLSQCRIWELGSGIGLTGLFLAALGAYHVVLTDLPKVVPNLQACRDLNPRLASRTSVRALAWGQGEESKMFGQERMEWPQLVVGVDCVYPGTFDALAPTLRILTQNGATILLQQEMRGKRTKRFFRTLKKVKATVLHEEIVGSAEGERTLHRIYKLKSKSSKSIINSSPPPRRSVSTAATGSGGGRGGNQDDSEGADQGGEESGGKGGGWSNPKEKLKRWMANKRVNPSAERNSAPIAAAFKRILTKYKKSMGIETRGAVHVFEIASGTGQHGAYITPRVSNELKDVKVMWQPSELTTDTFDSIVAWAGIAGLRDDQNGQISVLDPVVVDASTDWAKSLLAQTGKKYDLMYVCNCIHIAPWSVAQGIMRGAGGVVRNGGLLMMYGPYAVNGILTPESNQRFDKWLRDKDPEFGVRDIKDLEEEGEKYGMKLIEMVEMPANNFIVVFKKTETN